MLNKFSIKRQHISNHDDFTLRQKLKLLKPNEDTPCDMKILHVTQQSFLYKISEYSIAKQAVIKDRYSQNYKFMLLLNNVYQAQMQIMQVTGTIPIEYF